MGGFAGTSKKERELITQLLLPLSSSVSSPFMSSGNCLVLTHISHTMIPGSSVRTYLQLVPTVISKHAHTGEQYPFVNIFKKFGVGQWKRCTKEGDVTPVMV